MSNSTFKEDLKLLLEYIDPSLLPIIEDVDYSKLSKAVSLILSIPG